MAKGEAARRFFMQKTLVVLHCQRTRRAAFPFFHGSRPNIPKSRATKNTPQEEIRTDGVDVASPNTRLDCFYGSFKNLCLDVFTSNGREGRI